MSSTAALPTFDHQCLSEQAAAVAFRVDKAANLRLMAMTLTLMIGCLVGIGSIVVSANVRHFLHLGALNPITNLALIAALFFAALVSLGGTVSLTNDLVRHLFLSIASDEAYGPATPAEVDRLVALASKYPTIAVAAKEWAREGLTIRHRDVEAASTYAHANEALLAQLRAREALLVDEAGSRDHTTEMQAS